MTDTDETLTLDPPGTIAVVGAGPIGIEAALYGRFLGYNISLWEAESVASSLCESAEKPVPMLPDRCLSPLAVSALQAQIGDVDAAILPTTCGEWRERALVPLTESDLLTGRLHMPARVVRIGQVPVSEDAEDESKTEQDAGSDDEPIPEDFRLHLESGSPVDVEAVIVAIGEAPLMELDFAPSQPYFFRLGQSRSGDPEQDLQSGRGEIVQVFAQLAGRPDLDLYRPRRG